MRDERRITAEKARAIVGNKHMQLQKELSKLYGAINTYAKSGMGHLETAYDKESYSKDDIEQIAIRLEADGYSTSQEETPEWYILKVSW